MTQNLSTRSLQLDIFRGCAALLMVVNHAGHAWLASKGSTGFCGAAVFLGSAAPALFFFATGVGMGLARKGATDWFAVGRKVALLFIADAFLNWAEGRWLGLDFFGFCAISMLAVSFVNATPRPRIMAAAAIALVLSLRYADATRIELLAPDAPWLAFVTGVNGVQDISYPLSPWLVFPLAGYLLGRASSRLESNVATVCFALFAAIALGGAFELAQRGAAVHRWGSVSFAYFVFATGFVALVWLLARWACTNPQLAFLHLRGPASLLVVPIHYAAIHLWAAVAPPPWSPQAWLAAVLVLTIFTVLTSRWLAGRLKAIAERPASGPGLIVAIAVSATACAAAAIFASPLACWLVACLSQIVIAANLARPSRIVIRPAPLRAL